MKINVKEEAGKQGVKALIELTKVNKRVKYKNPFYREIDFMNIEIGNKFNYGIVKDYDGDYLIIENEITKEEEYINKIDVLEEQGVFRE